MSNRKSHSHTLKKVEDYSNTIVPQANNLSKICVVIKVMRKNWVNEKDIAAGLSMSERQAGYYSDAMRFLNLTADFKYGKTYNHGS